MGKTLLLQVNTGGSVEGSALRSSGKDRSPGTESSLHLEEGGELIERKQTEEDNEVNQTESAQSELSEQGRVMREKR